MTTNELRRAGAGDIGYDAYAAARERFFARLRADSELRRLESLLRPDAGPVAPRADGGPPPAR